MKRLLSYLLISYFFLISLSAEANQPASLPDEEKIAVSGSTDFCEGGHVILSVAKEAEKTFQWHKNGTTIPTATGNEYEATETGDYHVVTMDAEGVIHTYPAVKVTEHGLPTANFSFAGAGQCPNTPIQFTNNSSGTDLTYLWNFDDPNSGDNTSTAKNPSHQFVGTPGNGTQTFTVKLTVTSKAGCSATLSKTVTTKQAPDPKLSGTGFTTYNDKPYFVQKSSTPVEFIFTNTSATKNTNTSYRINWGDGSEPYMSENFQSTKHVYGLGSHTIKYTVAGENGCEISKTYYVYVGGNPSVGWGSPGNTSICTGEELIFPITGTEDNPPGTIYTIKVNDDSSPIVLNHPLTENSFKHLFLKGSCGTTSYNNTSALPNSFTASIVAENPSGSTPAAVYGIYVSEKPKASFSITPAKNSCINKTVRVSNTGKGNIATAQDCQPGNSVWKIEAITGTNNAWSVTGRMGDDFGLDDPGTWDNGSESLDIRFSAPGTYKVTLRTGTFSSLNVSCGPDTKEEIICVNPLPVAKFDLNKQKGCAPLTVKASNLSEAPLCGDNTYLWSVSYKDPENCTASTSSYSFTNSTGTSSENPEITFKTPGIYTLSLITKNSNGDCASVAFKKEIIVKEKPVADIDAPNQICLGEEFSLSADVLNCSSDAPATYLWSFPGANITSSTDAAPSNISYTTAGSKTITLTVSNDCGPTTVTKTINVISVPDVNSVTDKIYCSGEKSTIVSFSNKQNNSSVTYRWANSNTAIGLTASGTGNIPSFTAFNTTSAAITSTITVIPKLNGCEGTPMMFKITVNPNAPIANAGLDQKLCNATTTKLSANSSSPSSGKWTLVSGPNDFTIDDDTKQDATINNLKPDATYVFRWTINGFSPCPSTQDDVEIINRLLPTTADAGTDIVICDYSVFNDSHSLNANTPKAYETGEWTIVSEPAGSAAIFSNRNDPTATILNLKPGEYELQWTISNDVCTDNSTNTVKLSVFALPVAGSLSSNESNVCSPTNSGTLLLSDYIGTIKQWESSSTGASGPFTTINHTGDTYSFSDLGASTWYRVKIVSAGNATSYCTDKEIYTPAFKITVSPPSVGGASSGESTVCAGSNSGEISLSGETGSVIRWERSTDEMSWSTYLTSSTRKIDYKNLSETTFFRAVVKSGACDESFSTTTKITVVPTADVADAGEDIFLCNFAGSLNLNANTPVNGSGEWKQISGPSIAFADKTNPKANITLNQTGEYVFQWNISNGTCPTSTSQMTISNYPAVVNTISGDATYCFGQNVMITGSTPTGGDGSYVYSWESSTDETNWSVLAGESGMNLSFVAKTTIYIRRKTQSGACKESYSSVTKIEVLPTVDKANAGEAIYLCSHTGPINLDANAPVNGSGEWKQISGPAITFSDKTNPKTSISLSQTGEYVFEWGISNKACPPSTSQISVYNYPAVTNSITGEATFCFSQNVQVTGDTPTGGDGSYVYSWESSTDQTNWSILTGENSTSLSFTADQTVYIRRMVKSGPCETISNAVLISVQPAITNNIINQNQNVCIGKPIDLLAGSAPAGGDGNFNFQWQQSTDEISWTNIVDATAKDYQPGSLTESLSFRRLVSTALCKDAQQSISNTVKITINPDAEADFSASITEGCIPFDLSKVIKVTPHPDKNQSYEWFADDVSIGKGENFPGYIMEKDGDKVDIKLIATSKFGCETATKEITFSTVEAVKALYSKDKIQGCGPLTVNFTNESSSLTGARFDWDFGDGQTSTAAQPAPVTFAPHPKHRDTTYVITLTATTTCGETTYIDSVKVRPEALAVFSPDKTNGCSPLEINFKNQSLGSPNTYTFDFGDGTQQTTTDNSTVTHTFTTLKTDTFTVTLYAENECGKSSSTYDIVVYPNTITPELVINGSSSYGCAPLTVKFDNNSTGANNFKWDFKDGETLTTSESPESVSHTFNEPGTYEVLLVASNGCSTAQTSETVVVYEPIASDFFFDKEQYCVNEKVSITNLNDDKTYIWDFGDGNNSNEVHPEHFFASSGKFKVKLTAVQSYSDGTSCSVTTVKEVEVIPQPDAVFVSNATPLNCAPFTLEVHASHNNVTGGLEWHFGDSSNPDYVVHGFSGNYTYTEPGVYKVTAIAYNQSGCSDSTTQIVRVTASPKAAFSTADTMICGPGGIINFTNTTTYTGVGALEHNWFVDNNFVDKSKDLTYDFVIPPGVILPHTFEVKLITKSPVGCADTVKHRMQFNPLPDANFTVDKDLACAPFSVKINNASTFADAYAWYLDDVLVSTEKTPQNIVLDIPSKTYRLKLVASNIYGCKEDELETTLNTLPKPDARFSVNSNISCNGRLNLQTTNNSLGATSYTWNFGDGSPESNITDPSHSYGAPGVYTLRLIASNGICNDTTSTDIFVEPITKATFIANKVKGCTKVDITFENLSDNAQSYLWDFGDGTFSGSKNPTHTFNYNNSPFDVKLIAYGANGCNDTTVITNYIDVSRPPIASFEVEPDTIIKIPNYTFFFKNISRDSAITYLWDFGDGQTSTQENPTVMYTDSGTYEVRLIAITQEGCRDTMIRKVTVSGVPGFLFVPNAFEPESNISDLRTFKLRGSGMAVFSIKIFNKWGEVIWQSDQLDENGAPKESWNGTMKGQPAPQGVYIWDVYARFLDGNEWKGMKYGSGPGKTTGPVHLIR